MLKPPGLLNRGNLSEDKHALHWIRGKAAGRVVHAYLLTHDIKDIILEEEHETSGGRKYDLDIRVGDRVIDAKCSTMGLLTVPVDQQQLRCDIYAYVDITRRGACYEFIGWMLKEAFWSIADVIRKGNALPTERELKAFYDLGCVPPDILHPAHDLLPILKSAASPPPPNPLEDDGWEVVQPKQTVQSTLFN